VLFQCLFNLDVTLPLPAPLALPALPALPLFFAVLQQLMALAAWGYLRLLNALKATWKAVLKHSTCGTCSAWPEHRTIAFYGKIPRQGKGINQCLDSASAKPILIPCCVGVPRLLEMFSYLLYIFLSKIDAIHVFHVCFICSCLYAHMLRIFNLNIWWNIINTISMS